MKSQKFTIRFNSLFHALVEKYHISEKWAIQTALPSSVLQYINTDIIDNERGISFKTRHHDLTPPGPNEDLGLVEDYTNSFHLDDYYDHPNEEHTFKLGVRVAFQLANRFYNEKKSGIRVTYSFTTIEMHQKLNKHHNITESAIYCDSLSFNRIRSNDKQDVNEPLENYLYNAVLLIEI